MVFRIDPKPKPQPEPDGPAWWKRALAHERADRFKEAEKAILDGESSIGAWSQIAYLYELRLDRKLAAGDLADAKDAFERAADALSQYASSATSGGEGVALSAERDERTVAMQQLLKRHGASV